MSVQKYRWSRVYESSEEELIVLLQQRNITAQRVSVEAGSDQSELVTAKDTVIWCAEGSLAVRTDNTSTSLQPGDALRVSAQTACELHPGISGYVYYLST